MGLSVHDPFVDPLGNPLGLARSGADITPVGTITTRTGGPAANELPADGRSLLKADYSKLYTVIGYAYSSSVFAKGSTPASASSLVTLPVAVGWADIAFGNGIFIAVSSNTVSCAVSTDGSTWTAGADLPFTTAIEIVYGNGVFIVVNSASGFIAISQDGKSWTSISTTLAASSIAYGDGRFVIVGQTSSPSSRFSTDNGLTWQAGGSLGSAGPNPRLCFGSGVFVAVPSSTTGPASRSINGGVTWANASGFSSSNGFSDVAFGNGVFIAIASGSSSNQGYTSSDFGLTWVLQTGLTGVAKITFAIDRFVAPSLGSSTQVYTTSLGTFTGSDIGSYSLPNSAIRTGGIAYGNGVLVFLTSGSSTAAITNALDPLSFDIPSLLSKDPLRNSYVRAR